MQLLLQTITPRERTNGVDFDAVTSIGRIGNLLMSSSSEFMRIPLLLVPLYGMRNAAVSW